MDSISVPLLNPVVPGAARSIVVDRQAQDNVVTIHSLLTAFQQDAPHFDDRGDDQVQHSQSDNAGPTCMASGSSPAVLVPTQSGLKTDTASVRAPDTLRSALLRRSFRLPDSDVCRRLSD